MESDYIFPTWEESIQEQMRSLINELTDEQCRGALHLISGGRSLVEAIAYVKKHMPNKVDNQHK